MLDIVTNGYKLPFIAYPQPMIAKNHHSALKHSKFVKDSIGDLVWSHGVRESISCPIVCSPLLVIENAKGKLRLVIILTSTMSTSFLTMQYKFKYEGLDLISSLFRKGDFVSTFDLKSGYHHVDIHAESQPYLGFSWDDWRNKKFYIFVCSLLVYQLLAMCLPNFGKTMEICGVVCNCVYR